MSDHQIASGTKAGTVGGTLLSVVMNIDAGDILRTVILATVGAIVSFSISVLLKWLVRSSRRKRDSVK
ncbi:hypothetical protein [Ekhidna lutea]|uniref:Uncharacterized protein n=1 Tax=Ekhidna lutea TaxID=447679 RepID=A0A239KJK5_EKHLU|nr:hypothetical protein [Ekhidna lutea]SNT17344.1 hypothetical protein SAMN05421640_2653 [Ekhidna lutea]